MLLCSFPDTITIVQGLAMAFLLEKLEVYKKAIDFTEQVIKESRAFPKGNSGQRLDLISDAAFRTYVSKADEIAKMLTGLARVGRPKTPVEQ